MIRNDAGDMAENPADPLMDLVRRERGHMSARQQVEGAQALVARFAWKRRESWTMARSVAAFAVAAGVLALTFKLGFDRHTSKSLSYAVEGGQVEPGGFIRSDDAVSPKVRFSDGSEVLLQNGAKVFMRSLDDHGARVSLTQGHAHVEVVHKPDTHWLVDAGPFLITVTGTAFTVDWTPADEQLDVRMERGTIEVSGPLSDQPVFLHSGQHLRIGVRERQTLISDARDEASAAAQALLPSQGLLPLPTATADEDTAKVAKGPSDPKIKSSTRATSAAGSRDWAAKLASGEFEAIVAEAKREGLDEALADTSVGDLAALADAARYGRHVDIARRALLALGRRFPASAPARDGRFLLGRLEEAEQQPSKAVEWYDRYLLESPAGTYSSEALGRKMNLLQRLYGDERARTVAAEYLNRFPRGTYAARARALSQAP